MLQIEIKSDVRGVPPWPFEDYKKESTERGVWSFEAFNYPLTPIH